MNADEMTRVLQVLASCWPNADVERRSAAGYSLLCRDLDGPVVIAVIRDLALEGREFPPPPGVVANLAQRRQNQAILAAAASGELPIEEPALSLSRPRKDLD